MRRTVASMAPRTALVLPLLFGTALSLRAGGAVRGAPALPAINKAASHAAAAAAFACSTVRPALALGAKKAVPFTLFGRTSAELFPIQNLSLLTWSLLLFLPRWKLTPALALVAPFVHSVLYAKLLVHMVNHPVPGLTVDFNSLAGIMPGFTIPDGAFAGWLHYCTFDPLVGLGIVVDAKRMRIPHLLCVPCLVATCLAGPAGFAAYLLLRTLILGFRARPKMAPPKGFEWGKTF